VVFAAAVRVHSFLEQDAVAVAAIFTESTAFSAVTHCPTSLAAM
jgi:hypothetical protein